VIPGGSVSNFGNVEVATARHTIKFMPDAGASDFLQFPRCAQADKLDMRTSAQGDHR
jgi:hypothetical protein